MSHTARTRRPLATLIVCALAVLAVAIAPSASADETTDAPGQDSGNCVPDG